MPEMFEQPKPNDMNGCLWGIVILAAIIFLFWLIWIVLPDEFVFGASIGILIGMFIQGIRYERTH